MNWYNYYIQHGYSSAAAAAAAGVASWAQHNGAFAVKVVDCFSCDNSGTHVLQMLTHKPWLMKALN